MSSWRGTPASAERRDRRFSKISPSWSLSRGKAQEHVAQSPQIPECCSANRLGILARQAGSLEALPDRLAPVDLAEQRRGGGIERIGRARSASYDDAAFGDRLVRFGLCAAK